MNASSLKLGTVVAAVVLAAVLSGCKKEPAPAEAPKTESQKAESQKAEAPEAEAPAAISDADRAQAKEIFSTRCTPCHGPTGGGDGPASAGLTPPPRNFHDAKWQASVTDSHIETIIQYGGVSVGKSPAMPPNPDLVDKPVVKALREHIRSLKQ